MKRFLLLLLIPLLLSSCMTRKMCERRCQRATSVKDSSSVLVVTKDTVIYSENDTAWLELLLECADSNQVYITKLNEKSGKTVKTEVVYRDRIMYVTATVTPEPIKIETVRYIKDTTTIRATYGTRDVEKPLSWWQKFLMWSGAIFYGLLFLILIYKYLKIRYRI